MRLAAISPCPITTKDGAVALPWRSLSGYLETAKLWPGPFQVIAPPCSTTHAETTWTKVLDLPFDVVVADNLPLAARRFNPHVITALHRPDQAWVADFRFPAAVTTEFDFIIRLEQLRSRKLSALESARSVAGLAKRERVLRDMAHRAAGLQCNGQRAFSAYGRGSRNAIQFNDHRIFAEDLSSLPASKQPGARLQVAFSGRLIPEKGALDVLKLATECERRSLPVDVHVLGDGPYASHFQKGVPKNLVFHGFMNFDPQWKDFMRNRIDIAVLPHPQGDPSMTYFEAMGCGVPVLGYPNSTWAPFVERHGGGWVSRSATGSALADTCEGLLTHPSRIVRARTQGLAYMREQPFETVMQRRVDHLMSVI